MVRFVAAFLVYVYHSNQRFLSTELLPASHYGHSSVIVFFVLSGFVIAYVCATRETNLNEYAASRISRVFSVTVPAILLTLGLDALGRMASPEVYAGYPFDQLLVRSLSSLFLLNELGMGHGRWHAFPLWGWGLGLAIHGIVTLAALQGQGLRQRMLEKEIELLRRQR